MANFIFYAPFYYAAALVVASGEQIPRMCPEFPEYYNTNLPAVRSIELSIEPSWTGDFAVDNGSTSREINVFERQPIRDQGSMMALSSKYFEGAPRDRLGFCGNGIAKLKLEPEDHNSLDIVPLNRGTYHFGYGIMERNHNLTGKWTVFSVPSYTIQQGMFFKYELKFSRFQIAEDVRTHNLRNLGVRMGAKRQAPEIYGLGSDVRNGTILKIRMKLEDSSDYIIKVRFLKEDSTRPTTLCSKPGACLETIKLWIKNFDQSIQNKEKLAECVATRFGKDTSSLIEVKYGDYGSDATLFEAQPLDVNLVNFIDHIPTLFNVRTRTCPFDFIGYYFSYGPQGPFRSKEPPAPVFPASTTTEASTPRGSEVNVVGPVKLLSTTTEAAAKLNTIDDSPIEVSSTTTEAAPKKEAIDVFPNKVPDTIDFISTTTQNVPTRRPFGHLPDDISSTTTENAPEGIVPDLNRVEVPSTTTESIFDSNAIDVHRAKAPSTTTEKIPNSDTSSRTAADSYTRTASPTTTESPPDTNVVDVDPTKAPPTTTERVLESEITGTSTVQVPAKTEPSSSTESSTPPKFESSGNPQASEVNRTRDKPLGSYASFAEHIYFYAIFWTIVFIVLFVLIACVSR